MPVSKHIGDHVCMEVAQSTMWGEHWNETVTANVEQVSGGRIRVRIVNGHSLRYDGVDLRQDVLLWDAFNNWRHCQSCVCVCSI
jgi:hypothetical protein